MASKDDKGGVTLRRELKKKWEGGEERVEALCSSSRGPTTLDIAAEAAGHGAFVWNSEL